MKLAKIQKKPVVSQTQLQRHVRDWWKRRENATHIILEPLAQSFGDSRYTFFNGVTSEGSKSLTNSYKIPTINQKIQDYIHIYGLSIYKIG